MSEEDLGPNVHPLRNRARPIWWARCQTNSRRQPLYNLNNCLLALREDPAWKESLAFDEMLQSPVLRGKPVTDIDITRIQAWMQAVGLFKMGSEAVRDAVDQVARERRFHPICDWLNALVPAWDGLPRLATWLSACLGAPDNPYHQEIGARFIIGMVARVMQPGCKADYMLVLEGSQGTLKSQACQILAGAYYSDMLPDLAADPIRVSMHLRGKWLIEVPELSAFTKPDAARLKAFLTNCVEQYAPKFARREVQEPRQCLFVGTTNDDAYLRDPTGGRRFWPVRCGVIDLKALRDMRNHLFAEAMCAYSRGAHWWPDPAFEHLHIKPVQESRYEADPWEDPILTYLSSRFRVTIPELATDCLKLHNSQLGTLATRRIAAILVQAGWSQVRTNIARFWVPPSSTQSTVTKN